MLREASEETMKMVEEGQRDLSDTPMTKKDP